MPSGSKRKGNRYENEIRKALESAGFDAVRNTQYDQRYKGASDVVARPPTGPVIHVECKRHKRDIYPGKPLLAEYDRQNATAIRVGEYVLTTLEHVIDAVVGGAQPCAMQQAAANPTAAVIAALEQAETARDESGDSGVPIACFRLHQTSRDLVFLRHSDYLRLFQSRAR